MSDDEQRSTRFRETWYRRLDVANLPPDLDRLALVLASRARADGTRAVASHRWLAGRLGWSESTVKRRLAVLAGERWIERTEKGTRKGSKVTANAYRLLLPAVSTGQSTAKADLLTPTLNRSAGTHQQVTETPSTGHAPACAEPPPRESPPSTYGAAPADRPLPPDFQPNGKNRTYALRIRADLEHERRCFLAKYLTSGEVRSDWQRVFYKWLENVEEHGRTPGMTPPPLERYTLEDGEHVWLPPANPPDYVAGL